MVLLVLFNCADTMGADPPPVRRDGGDSAFFLVLWNQFCGALGMAYVDDKELARLKQPLACPFFLSLSCEINVCP